MAMDFVRGESLHEALRREGFYSEKDALQIIRKIASALDSAWTEHQMLHRDIKPQNIMMDTNGEPLLMDMGLSKSLAEDTGLTQTSMVMGTPNYSQGGACGAYVYLVWGKPAFSTAAFYVGTVAAVAELGLAFPDNANHHWLQFVCLAAAALVPETAGVGLSLTFLKIDPAATRAIARFVDERPLPDYDDLSIAARIDAWVERISEDCRQLKRLVQV